VNNYPDPIKAVQQVRLVVLSGMLFGFVKCKLPVPNAQARSVPHARNGRVFEADEVLIYRTLLQWYLKHRAWDSGSLYNYHLHTRCLESCSCNSAHTHNHFTSLWILSRTTRVSQYQKKHSSTHTYCHQSSLICFLHLL